MFLFFFYILLFARGGYDADVLKKTEATLNIIPDLLRVLKPMFITLTFFESEHSTLPCVCNFLFFVHRLIFFFLTFQVFPALRDLFYYYRDHLTEVRTATIVKIAVGLCNILYDFTLHGDYALYFSGAFALSLPGGEEWRRRISNDTSDLQPAFQLKHLNFAKSLADVDDAAVRLFEEDEIVFAEGVAEDVEDTDGSGDFVPTNRDKSLVATLQKREVVLRLKSQRNIKEKAEEKDVYDFFLYACAFECVHVCV